MEEFLEAVTGGAIWGVGFGVALAAVQAVGTGVRPVAKDAMRGAMALGDWVRDASSQARENLEDSYNEARASVQQERQSAHAAESGSGSGSHIITSTQA